MLKLVDLYLLRKIIATSLVMTGVGLAVLLLERVLRLFGLVANPNKAFSFVGQMLVLLTPHYLSVALPAAFFFGVLLTFLRLRQDNELVVLSSVGQGLHRLIAPATRPRRGHDRDRDPDPWLFESRTPATPIASSRTRSPRPRSMRRCARAPSSRQTA